MHSSDYVGLQFCRILDVIEEFGDIIDLGDDNTETLAQDNYVIHVDERDVNTFVGITLELGTDIDRLDTFQEDSISTVAQEVETNRTGACSFSLPDTFLNDLIRSGFGAARSRFNYAIFRNDSLFQPRSRDRSSLEVASVIVSVSVAGFDRIEGLSRPARSRFQIREVYCLISVTRSSNNLHVSFSFQRAFERGAGIPAVCSGMRD